MRVLRCCIVADQFPLVKHLVEQEIRIRDLA